MHRSHWRNLLAALLLLPAAAFAAKPARPRNFIKPNVATDFTGFASALAFGDNNRVLAVGAAWESSGARDIDGDPNDTSGYRTGAVWLY
jgi:hypothetical protein